MTTLLSIGEFARLTHLSVRTLRRHHDSGLLRPASVDPVTGYRSYTRDQVATAQVVHQLRELDVPLADVRRILDTDDPAERAALAGRHLRQLQDQLERTRSAVGSLQRLLAPPPAAGPGAPDVEVRRVPALRVAAVQDVVDRDAVLDWYAEAAAELDRAVPAPGGPPGGLYADELFTAGRGSVLVHLPLPDAGTVAPTGRVREVTLPAVELAVARHRGEHADIDVTYGELGGWVLDHALGLAAPVRETYVCGPRDTPDPAQWVTELGWPVFRLA